MQQPSRLFKQACNSVEISNQIQEREREESKDLTKLLPCSKPLGGSKVDSAFHPSNVDKMTTRNFWELSGKK